MFISKRKDCTRGLVSAPPNTASDTTKIKEKRNKKVVVHNTRRTTTAYNSRETKIPGSDKKLKCTIRSTTKRNSIPQERKRISICINITNGYIVPQFGTNPKWG